MSGVQMNIELNLAKTLNQVRSKLLAGLSNTDREAYTHLVDWLRKTDVASGALQVGDTAPDFLLPDVHGRLHSSEHLRGDGPLVVSFYRGGWCPFCNAELRALQAVRAEFDSLKANLVVLSPETGDLPRRLKRELSLDLTVLADVDHAVAISYGVLFRLPDETKAHYARQGYDFGRRHGSTEWMLPIPATFVVDQGGIVRGAFVEPDFTIRQEPSDILNKLRQLAGSQSDEPSLFHE
ncbi:alkyl hydroperoxide reductase [Bradyrhizobium nanningense]|uniref:thioredoxin-dependent peroxiredoxin n=2 Tax=Bradyrhizobium nanningense TaxID=1325118 RepID=A0A4Q0RWY0_9BRAD|nr:alkyl hydroperoxide reductase [Bradyrhizobium nanningense]RXH29295.1 alkyl hydroperoxide reductase [Bradyrhizobium nanningense]